MTALRAILRRSTEDDHAALDAALAPADFDDPAAYAHFLRAQAGALYALEKRLEAADIARVLPDWPTRRRAGAMADDLAALGGAPVALAHAGALHTRAAQFGALYVLEGSRLGGAIMLKRARASADAAVRGATAFLAHGEGRRLWPSFVEALEASPDAHGDVEALVAGARDAFALFARAVSLMAPSPQLRG